MSPPKTSSSTKSKSPKLDDDCPSHKDIQGNNLEFIRFDPNLISEIVNTGMIQQPVKTALKKLLLRHEYQKVRYGYRRSEATRNALILSYFEGDIPKKIVLKDVHYHKALKKLRELFAPNRIMRPISFPDLRFYTWRKSASAEVPFTTDPGFKSQLKKLAEQGLIPNTRPTFSNMQDIMYKHCRTFIHRIKDGFTTDEEFGRDLRFYNTAHARSHLVKADEPDKVRMVFGVPKTLIFAEAMFLWPIIAHLNLNESPMLWGYETLKGGWSKIKSWETALQPEVNTWLAFDWKHFDKTASFDVIDDIHEILESYIDFEHGYEPVFHYPESSTNPIRLKRLWNWMCDAIKTTPDVLPNGEMYRRKHSGIASGFFQTQLLGSMYNALMLLTVLSRMGINIDTLHLKVQGDDSLIGLNEPIHPTIYEPFMEEFAYFADEYFGATLNTKKSKMGPKLHGLPVLGYTNNNGFPKREKEHLLATLLYPERFCDNDRLMARAVGIAYANCGNHKDVYNVCSDIYEFLKLQGHSPNRAGLPDSILSLETQFFNPDNYITERFPSYYETFREVLAERTRTQAERDKVWPSYMFLTDI